MEHIDSKNTIITPAMAEKITADLDMFIQAVNTQHLASQAQDKLFLDAFGLSAEELKEADLPFRSKLTNRLKAELDVLTHSADKLASDMMEGEVYIEEQLEQNFARLALQRKAEQVSPGSFTGSIAGHEFVLKAFANKR